MLVICFLELSKLPSSLLLFNYPFKIFFALLFLMKILSCYLLLNILSDCSSNAPGTILLFFNFLKFVLLTSHFSSC
jgi:hypothetical protein